MYCLKQFAFDVIKLVSFPFPIAASTRRCRLVCAGLKCFRSTLLWFVVSIPCPYSCLSLYLLIPSFIRSHTLAQSLAYSFHPFHISSLNPLLIILACVHSMTDKVRTTCVTHCVTHCVAIRSGYFSLMRAKASYCLRIVN